VKAYVWPEVNLEMALICYAKGKKSVALDYLHTKLKICGNADPDYKACKARKLLNEWESETK